MTSPRQILAAIGRTLAALDLPALAPAGRRYFSENGAGLAGSALLHGLAVLLILFCVRGVARAPQADMRTVLVDIVRLGETTMSPPAEQKSAMPQEQAVARVAPAHSPLAVAPARKTAPPDDLQSRLNALAKLRQPETDPRVLQGLGSSTATSTSNDASAGDAATYSLRDFVRAQVERRWNLDLGLLGTRNLVIALRVVMTSAGVIADVQVVDKGRLATDAVFRRIALSARNAVLLSSPIALPAGNYPATTEMTLKLDPRDTLR
jgi:hypothetical protein